LPPRLRAELTRELNRLELVISQVAAVEDERDRALISVLAGTDPVLLMEVDPASAHEFLFNW